MLPKNILETTRGRLAAFSLLYLSEGIPFGFSAVALVTFMRQQGVGLTEIGLFTASLYAPWGLKWAWAPFVDLIRVSRFGARRFWIVVGQVLMAVTLGVVMVVDPVADLRLLTLLMVVHNLFAATQDIAIDALAVQVLPENERGTANGFMFGASYLGQAIGGSGAIWLAGQFGFKATFPFVCGLILMILIFVSWRIREPAIVAGAAEIARGTAETARDAAGVLGRVARRLGKYGMDLVRGFFLSGSGPVVGVVYGLLPPGALALGLALGSTLQVDLGMDENEIARITLFSTVASALGCVVGGWVSDRLGHRKMLAVWTVLTTLPTLWLAGKFTGVEGVEGVTIRSFYIGSILYAFAAGLIYGTSVAVFMNLTSPIVAATQFSGYMALHNFVYSYSSAWQGQYAEAFGYARTMRLDAWIALVPILTFPFLRPASKEILSGPVASLRLTKFASVFLLLTGIAASLTGDWRAPGREVLAVWAVVLLALVALAARARENVRFGTVGLVVAVTAAALVGRWLDGGEFDRTVQIMLAAVAASLVALGLLVAGRYEQRKAHRLARQEALVTEGAAA